MSGIQKTLSFFEHIDLLEAATFSRFNWILDSDFLFHSQRKFADSIHVHIKVPDTDKLPDDAIRIAGAETENRQTGYVKYVFPSGVNVIFSSIPVAEEDRLPDAHVLNRPFLDHIGLDMRNDSPDVRSQFDAVGVIAERSGWAVLTQGGKERGVFCCHTQVAEKRWVYPPENFSPWRRPIEFAYGPLVVHSASMGCDLRPRDPFLATIGGDTVRSTCSDAAVASTSRCCSPGKPAGD